MTTATKLPKLTVRDRDADTYPTFWGVVERSGALLACAIDGDDWQTSEDNLRKLAAREHCIARAVARFTHPAYTYPIAARQHAVDLILEEAERVLCTPAAIGEGDDA